jgi:Gluconate 2-dehydrogenase subunit 3
MKRRTAIRNVVIISAGAALLPSCSQKGKGSSLPLKNISLTGSEENMLAELAETIIPKTKDFTGAKELKAHEFILTMVDDCASPEDQKKFTEGLKSFDKLSHEKFGEIFSSYTADQKKELLTAIENKKNIPDETLQFYGTVKRYTLQNFTSSRDYMLDIKKYKMVPGPIYKGCVPVS